jgi:uncharacterized membrane protein YwzB
MSAEADTLAKKTQESNETDLVRTVVSTASKYVMENVFGKINDEIRLVLGTVEKKGYEMQERMLQRLFSFVTLVLAFIFIVLAINSFLLEYLNLTKTEAYLLVGVVLLAIYYLLKRGEKRKTDIQEA